MSHRLSPLVATLCVALASSTAFAKPAAKAPAKPAPAAAPTIDFKLAHNLGPVGEEQLQAVVALELAILWVVD